MYPQMHLHKHFVLFQGSRLCLSLSLSVINHASRLSQGLSQHERCQLDACSAPLPSARSTGLVLMGTSLT